MNNFNLAQINIGRFIAPCEDPQIADFMANLDAINALAEDQAGFIWRLTGEGNNATDIRAFEDPLMSLNMSVWENADALASFVYRTQHRAIMRRRREWFEPIEVFMALWWVPVGHEPTPLEGIARLDQLKRCGPSQAAFTFHHKFSAPDERHRCV